MPPRGFKFIVVSGLELIVVWGAAVVGGTESATVVGGTESATVVIGTESGTDVSSEGAFVASLIKATTRKVPTIHSQTGSLTTLRLYYLSFAEGSGKELSLIRITLHIHLESKKETFLDSK